MTRRLAHVTKKGGGEDEKKRRTAIRVVSSERKVGGGTKTARDTEDEENGHECNKARTGWRWNHRNGNKYYVTPEWRQSEAHFNGDKSSLSDSSRKKCVMHFHVGRKFLIDFR